MCFCNSFVRYRHLFLWDVAMHALESRHLWMASKVMTMAPIALPPPSLPSAYPQFITATSVMFVFLQAMYVSLQHEGDKMIVFERGSSR